MTLDFPERFNMADYFLYHNLEEGRENKVCLYFEDQTFTYRETIRLSNRTGNALRELGVEIEDRVLLVLPDCPEFVWTWFGSARIGAVITMVNPLLPAEDYKYYLDYTRATVAVVHESLLKTFNEAAAEARYLRAVLVVGDREHDHDIDFTNDRLVWSSFNGAVLSADDECKPADTHRDDIAIWLFTSGSTGHPKGAVHLQHDLPFNTEVLAKRTMGVNATDVSSRDLSSLRFCYAAGEALPIELYERGKTSLGVEICDGIGSAEKFHIYITNRPGDVKPGSLGKIVEGYEAKIVDAEGREVPTGDMGTLKIKGDSAALCYWNAHEKSKETFAGDWCITGDQFHVDDEGYYWYHGRTDDMLKVSGIFVAPAEIENCLLQHEAVLECAVIGYDSGDGLVKPKAFVVLRENRVASDELADQIKDFVKSKIVLSLYPRWIEIVAV